MVEIRSTQVMSTQLSSAIAQKPQKSTAPKYCTFSPTTITILTYLEYTNPFKPRRCRKKAKFNICDTRSEVVATSNK